jgi:hypothetical protein
MTGGHPGSEVWADSAPLKSLAASLPEPPLKRSATRPPLSRSLPGPPCRRSRPGPPKRRSLPPSSKRRAGTASPAGGGTTAALGRAGKRPPLGRLGERSPQRGGQAAIASAAAPGTTASSKPTGGVTWSTAAHGSCLSTGCTQRVLGGAAKAGRFGSGSMTAARVRSDGHRCDAPHTGGIVVLSRMASLYATPGATNSSQLRKSGRGRAPPAGCTVPHGNGRGPDGCSLGHGGQPPPAGGSGEAARAARRGVPGLPGRTLRMGGVGGVPCGAWCARHAARATCDYRCLTRCWLAGGDALDAPLNGITLKAGCLRARER